MPRWRPRFAGLIKSKARAGFHPSTGSGWPELVEGQARGRGLENQAALRFRGSQVSGSPDFDRFLRHCARFWAIAPRVYPRGVFKFRSIEHVRHPVKDE
jgi:hypothetical protein